MANTTRTRRDEGPSPRASHELIGRLRVRCPLRRRSGDAHTPSRCVLFALLLLSAGCRLPPNVERDRWVLWFNAESRRADSLVAEMDRGNPAAASALSGLLQADADSIPWSNAVLGADSRRRHLAHLIVRTRVNAEICAIHAETRLGQRLQGLGAAADSLWEAEGPAAGRAAWRGLLRAADSLDALRAPYVIHRDRDTLDLLLARALAGRADSSDTSVTPRLSRAEVWSLRDEFRRRVDQKRELRVETERRVPRWEERLRHRARRAYVDRHNELMRAMDEAGRIDRAGRHGEAARSFRETEARADSLGRVLRADTLLRRSAANRMTEVSGEPLAEAAEAADPESSAVLDLVARIDTLRRLASANLEVALYNGAARRYRELSLAWAEGRIAPRAVEAGIDSLLGVPALDRELRDRITGLRREVREARR